MFKVGDRVIGTQMTDNPHMIGVYGTIIKYNNNNDFLVQFDCDIHGHGVGNREWWCCHDNVDLVHQQTVTIDGNMQFYSQPIIETQLWTKQDIGDDTMKILEIYAERKRKKTNEKYDKLQETIKLTDAKYKIWKNCVDTLDALYKQDKIAANHFAMINLSEDTLKMLETNDNLRRDELKKLDELIEEVHAQLSMCETYEQKQNVLNTYKILKANGKVNG